EGRRPSRFWLLEACLAETPGYKCSTPGITFRKVCVFQVFTNPFAIIFVGFLPHPNLFRINLLETLTVRFDFFFNNLRVGRNYIKAIVTSIKAYKTAK